jgi:cAMP phosphodiesterase
VIKVIRKSLLDGSIWPDFTVIPNSHEGILNLLELKPGQSIEIDDLSVTPYLVSHSVPATGYLVEDKKKRRFFYTGDTGPTESTWSNLEGIQIHNLLIEASFPNRMEEIALRTGHLTPRLLRKELSKIKPPPERISIIHIKPPYSKTVTAELQKLKIKNLALMKDGQTLQI